MLAIRMHFYEPSETCLKEESCLIVHVYFFARYLHNLSILNYNLINPLDNQHTISIKNIRVEFGISNFIDKQLSTTTTFSTDLIKSFTMSTKIATLLDQFI